MAATFTPHTRPQVERLGGRHLPATGIFFDALTGEVVIEGTPYEDNAGVQVITVNGAPHALIGLVSTDDQGMVIHNQTVTLPLSALEHITFTGFNGDDVFANYAPVPSTAYGGRGSDHLIGGGGDDRLVGQNGTDRLEGFGGADTLLGGNGMDFLYGGNGADSLSGGSGTDFLYGENGNDTLASGGGTDAGNGGNGTDALTGIP